MAKLKFEKLFINLHRRGEIRFETAYNARDAARIAAKHARQGWLAKIESRNGRSPFMTCEPGREMRKHYEYGPEQKPFARCKMTPAFKKRIQGRK